MCYSCCACKQSAKANIWVAPHHSPLFTSWTMWQWHFDFIFRILSKQPSSFKWHFITWQTRKVTYIYSWCWIINSSESIDNVKLCCRASLTANDSFLRRLYHPLLSGVSVCGSWRRGGCRFRQARGSSVMCWHKLLCHRRRRKKQDSINYEMDVLCDGLGVEDTRSGQSFLLNERRSQLVLNVNTICVK